MIEWAKIGRVFESLVDMRTIFSRSLGLCVSAVAFVYIAAAQGLPVAAPGSVGMNAAKLDQIEALVNADIADKKLPGAVVVVGHKGRIVYRKAFGNRSLVPTVEKMTVDTIFDVASLTKPVATATSIMILVEQGRLRLNDTIGMHIPDIDDEQAKRVTILQLLTHTSGYRPDFDLGEKWTGRDGMLAALKKEKLRNAPGTRFVYSDIGFIVLGEIIERVSGDPVAAFSFKSFDHLGMSHSKFLQAGLWRAGEIERNPNFASHPGYDIHDLSVSQIYDLTAPTENVKGQQSYLGSNFDGNDSAGTQILRTQVHDPTAFRMDGIAGHAGLFATADDLARYCQMLLNGGAVPKWTGRHHPNGFKSTDKMPPGLVRFLSPQAVARMTQPYVVSENGYTRGLGWDMNTGFSSNRGELFPLGSFGHTGFTGTSIWIDPVSETFVVFMSNSVHPYGKGSVTPTRAKVATIAASAIEDVSIEDWKEAEAEYNSAVAAQIPKFTEQVETARQRMASDASPRASGTSAIQSKTVLNGIDILERDGFKQLDGKRIGLVTNHTGRNFAGKPTIDVLFEAKNVKLISLFAPEHGIRGELDTEKIDDTKDDKTGLPVYSLYKDGMRRPKSEQLKDLDAIVYDIQDIGARFYTYTATLKNVLEEAAKAKIPVYVLDRPNPITGDVVEGPLADEDKLAFIAAHTIPVRYGLTIGELGLMMNAERKIGAELHVIEMENWSRSQWFDQTGQTWVNPSPNMRSLTQATLYPGIGLLETTNVSVGRGTDTPFEIVGAPWIDGQQLAKHLNERGLRGVRFVPVRFTPNASVFKGEPLGGINIVITDRSQFESVRTGFEIAAALRKLYPADWQVDRYLRLLVNAEVMAMVKRGDDAALIENTWKSSLDDFKKRRASYLRYK